MNCLCFLTHSHLYNSWLRFLYILVQGRIVFPLPFILHLGERKYFWHVISCCTSLSEQVRGRSEGGIIQCEMLFNNLLDAPSKIILAELKMFSIQIIYFSQPAQNQFMLPFYSHHDTFSSLQSSFVREVKRCLLPLLRLRSLFCFLNDSNSWCKGWQSCLISTANPFSGLFRSRR